MSDRQLDNSLLVARILEGDEAAFGRFIDDYYPRLYRFGYARVDRDRVAVQYVVHDTCAPAAQRQGRSAHGHRRPVSRDANGGTVARLSRAYRSVAPGRKPGGTSQLALETDSLRRLQPVRPTGATRCVDW